MLVKSILENKGFDTFEAAPEDTVLTVLRMFRANRVGFAVVRDDSGVVVGGVSERDICQAMSMEEGAGRSTAIKHVMVAPERCQMSDSLIRIMAQMTQKKTRHMLAYDDEGFQGVISIGDVVKNRLDEIIHEEEEILRYVEGTGYSFGT